MPGVWRGVDYAALAEHLTPERIGRHFAAIGHPLAASGARITVHLLHALRRGGNFIDRNAERRQRIDDRVDFGRETASGTTETMISTPLFAVAACWCARIEVLSIIWMSPSYASVIASISRSHTPARRQRTKRL